MNYESQEEHDHYEGAMEQGVPQEEPIHNTREGIEEKLKEFSTKFYFPIEQGQVKYEDIYDWLHQELQKARDSEVKRCIEIVESLRQDEPTQERLKDDPYLARHYEEYKDDVIGHNIVINKVKKAIQPELDQPESVA